MPESTSDGEALAIIRKIRVAVVDVSDGSSLEQACWLLLNARNCASPQLFWGILISDCTNYAAGRRSLSVDFLRGQYRNFFVPNQQPGTAQQSIAATMFQILEKGELPTGRELVLGTFDEPTAQGVASISKLFLFEFYRFDNSCNERIAFKDGECHLPEWLAYQTNKTSGNLCRLGTIHQERARQIRRPRVGCCAG